MLGAALQPKTHAATGAPVRLNTVGYLPRHGKRATLPAPCGEFEVVSISESATVMRGTAAGPFRDEETGEDLCVADFSALRTPDAYRLVAGGSRSSSFYIGRDVYVAAFKTAVRAMHLWRCGSAEGLGHDGRT